MLEKCLAVLYILFMMVVVPIIGCIYGAYIVWIMKTISSKI
jgi:hypothetical protein